MSQLSLGLSLIVLLRIKFAVFIILIFVGYCARAEKISEIQPQGYVTDLAQVIDPATKAKIEALCAEVEQKTGAQIAVVTVRSLEGESKEDYAVDLYKHLGVGSKKANRGVLLLIAPTERQYRIEVGYGLEPVINDARAGDIGRAMLPSLRSGDYSAAALMGVSSLAQLIAADKGVKLNGIRHAAAGSEKPLAVVAQGAGSDWRSVVHSRHGPECSPRRRWSAIRPPRWWLRPRHDLSTAHGRGLGRRWAASAAAPADSPAVADLAASAAA